MTYNLLPKETLILLWEILDICKNIKGYKSLIYNIFRIFAKKFCISYVEIQKFYMKITPF